MLHTIIQYHYSIPLFNNNMYLIKLLVLSTMCLFVQSSVIPIAKDLSGEKNEARVVKRRYGGGGFRSSGFRSSGFRSSGSRGHAIGAGAGAGAAAGALGHHHRLNSTSSAGRTHEIDMALSVIAGSAYLILI